MVDLSALIIGELTILNLLLFTVGLIIMWIIVSVPVYIAGKIVTAGKSTLGDAMIATLFGPIIYALTLFALDFLLGALIGLSSLVAALILAFIAWVWIFKANFRTSWLGGLAVAILAILVFTGISILFGTFLNVMVPAPFFPRL